MNLKKIGSMLVLALSILGATEVDDQIEGCKKGKVVSCYNAGISLTTGENAEDQAKESLGYELLRKACKFGEKKACNVMGEHYFKDKNYIAARQYLKDSCSHGVATACAAIGTIYRDALEVKRSDVKAREYYEKACELGSHNSCINVAYMYRGGFGVEKNRAQEKFFYKKSCDAGSKPGCEFYTKMDNKDKGIEEPSIFEKFLNLF